MEERLDPFAIAPELLTKMVTFSLAAENAGIEPSLLKLIKVRASQLNGCALCLKMHTGEARHAGETEERLYMLDAWEESPLYTPRERAALAWTDCLTDLVHRRAPDVVYEALAAEFTKEEQVKLTVAISVINAWNRLGVGFRRHTVPVLNKAAA